MRRANRKPKRGKPKETPQGSDHSLLFFSTLNKQFHTRPPVFTLTRTRKYNKGEHLVVNALALNGLVISLAQKMTQIGYRSLHDLYRIVENYVVFYLQREVLLEAEKKEKKLVASSDMLLVRSLGSSMY
eukprot:TRINITY_DN4480_c0_g1_i23.p1 TRINITY_DN4480_c0_g1~~TRINITY_DN4480_c0_g1_i23.p1  ORF type:complete len:129 (+),score=25.38 TRINITY_DN4480_c0_g1_i23:77-463(+)